MQKIKRTIIFIFLGLSGCATFPDQPVHKPEQQFEKPICIKVDFTQKREGPVSRVVEPFDLSPKFVALYRASLRKYGIESECEGSKDKYHFTWILRGGVKIPSFEMFNLILSGMTFGIIPMKSDVVIDLSYNHEREGGEVISHLIPITQWISTFLIPKSISQSKQARDDFALDSYWSSIIVSNIAKIIIENEKKKSVVSNSHEFRADGITTLGRS